LEDYVAKTSSTHPLFFVNVAATGLTLPISLLDATHPRSLVTVASKRVASLECCANRGLLIGLNGRELDDWVVAAIAERKSSKMSC
jgi:hypothetical protein